MAGTRGARAIIGVLAWPLAGIGVGIQVAEGVFLTRELPETLAAGDIARLAEAYPDSDLMLEVRTLYWNSNYFRRDWSKFHVAYGVRAELVDLRSRRSLAHGECSRWPEQPERGMSRDELLSDGAIRVKNILAEAGADCAIETGNTVFGQ